jgi:hypothetical protein
MFDAVAALANGRTIPFDPTDGDPSSAWPRIPSGGSHAERIND